MKHLFVRIELQLLMNLTAKAFDQKPLRVWTRPHIEALTVYAACTRDWMQITTRAP